MIEKTVKAIANKGKADQQEVEFKAKFPENLAECAIAAGDEKTAVGYFNAHYTVVLQQRERQKLEGKEPGVRAKAKALDALVDGIKAGTVVVSDEQKAMIEALIGEPIA